MTPSELKESRLWWHGPDWLESENSSWPQSNEFSSETMLEAKAVQVNIARSCIVEDILDRFSYLSRAIKVIGYIFRFVRNCSFKTISNHRKIGSKNMDPDPLSFEEIKMVRTRLFSISQQMHFPKEFQRLANKENLHSNSSLLTLTPFMDKDGVIRANGRLGSTTFLSYSERHPIILSYQSKLSRLYIDFVHKLVCHGGNRLVFSVVRHECWIIRAKSLIKACIRNCKECILYRKARQGQIMAALPETRTTFTRPFCNTGVDFAGPFDVKSFTGRYCKITKGYVCLFICFSTKAIHLEAVSDLSTSAFMGAFTRFVARRGCPDNMYSDNGRNFVGAAREISSDFAACVKEWKRQSVLKPELQNLKWHFIPAAAPHMGGLWEAGVKSTKMHLKKIAGQVKFTFEEFSTVLAGIEACLNSRPLGQMPDNSDELCALTPGHFLIGSAILSPAEPEELGSAMDMVNRWRKVKAMRQELSRRWKEEYLSELHKRNKWQTPQINLQEDDIVVLRNEPLCPTDWRLGRVIKIHRGSDNKVRVVDLQTKNGVITRPIHKLVLLPKDPEHH